MIRLAMRHAGIYLAVWEKERLRGLCPRRCRHLHECRQWRADTAACPPRKNSVKRTPVHVRNILAARDCWSCPVTFPGETTLFPGSHKKSVKYFFDRIKEKISVFLTNNDLFINSPKKEPILTDQKTRINYLIYACLINGIAAST